MYFFDMAHARQDAVGFPPPLLGGQPMRLPVLARGEGWLALDVPAGIGVRQHPWDRNVPHLDGALNTQLQGAKPELLRMGAELFGSVYYLEPDVSGVVLFGLNRDAVADLRNAYGSMEFGFTFHVLVRTVDYPLGAELLCDAPLLPHRVKPKMIPSTAKGKKCATRFRVLEVVNSGWSLLEARANFIREHQVRAHAATLGIPIVGDALYGGVGVPTLRELNPKKLGPGVHRPIMDGLAIHLSELRLKGGDHGGDGVVASPLPKHFSVLLRRLGFSSGVLDY